MKWPGLISLEKNLNEKTSAFVSLANEALQVQVKKAVCWPAPIFFFGFFVETRSIVT